MNERKIHIGKAKNGRELGNRGDFLGSASSWGKDTFIIARFEKPQPAGREKRRVIIQYSGRGGITLPLFGSFLLQRWYQQPYCLAKKSSLVVSVSYVLIEYGKLATP